MLYCASLVFALTFTLGSCANITGVKTTEQFDHTEILDESGNYILFWNANDTHVVFEVHVKTKGYVGFGISDNGNMFPGDVVVGFVKDGYTYFADYHTTRNWPVIDKSQDWFILHGEENEFGTVLKFVRKINTCDSAEDLVIQEETNRIIYSYGEYDPMSWTSLYYHGPSTRGTKSLSLLGATKAPASLESDISIYEFLNQNYTVPNDSTTYICTGFQMPDSGRKQHMVKFETMVTPGNELMIHHIILYRCKGIPASYDRAQGLCYDNSRPLPQCNDVILFLAWPRGGRSFYFPDKAGFPIGGPNYPSFYIMETHFDNPERKSGVIDNSGIRISLTKNLRPNDLGLLNLGLTTDFYNVIPPNQKDFISKAYCSASCITEGLEAAKIPEINVVGILQHANVFGVGIKTRHFRNGSELAPLADDPNFDFQFQEMRLLKEERVVKPGDSFSVECTYDTRGRSRPVFGGVSAQDEMCLTFAYYYPIMPVVYCGSNPVFDTYNETGSHLHNLLKELDYSDPQILEDFKQRMANSTVHHYCVGHVDFDSGVSEEWFVEHETCEPYRAPPTNCTLVHRPKIN